MYNSNDKTLTFWINILVDESLDHLQITTGTLKGERGVSSLIHCNYRYKLIVGTISFLEFYTVYRACYAIVNA